jgi:hypothetical protein
MREPFRNAGLIVAVVALVAALAGGAYAANALTGKEKKEVKTIAKKFAGKNGEQGPTGPAGPQGSKGDKGDTGAAGANGANGENGADGKDGKDGENGKDGKNGESVTVIPLPAGDANCKQGGAKFTNTTGTAYACNGTGGSSAGSEMAGYWEVLGEAGPDFPGFALTTISFPVRVETPPAQTVAIEPLGNTEEELDKCPGSFEDPQVGEQGVLCLYLAAEGPTFKFGAPTTFGAGLFFEEGDEGFGSWAFEPVSAP